MKKNILVALILAVLTLLTSCEGLFGGNTDTPTGPVTTDKTYSRIVYSDSELDLLEVRSKIMDLVGPIGMIAANAESETDGEIVFGSTTRAITAAAKAALENEIKNSTKYDSGYIVYAEGNNIAVFWLLDDMADLAINTFIKECLDTSSLKTLKDGVVYVKLYDAREFAMSGRWDSMEATHGEELTAAIRALYNYYDGPKIAGWIANLYDPVTGGFYYSRSARDYEGFLPDLESTAQALGILGSIGALNRDTMLPDDIKMKIVEFARNMQSANDGYFYHPQWPQDIKQLQTDRYGRDYGNAASIITSFTYDSNGDGVADKQYPKYCVANGVKCALHNGTNESCSFPVSTSAIVDNMSCETAVSVSLTASVQSSVSKIMSSTVAPTASVSSHPDYSSVEAFRTWLEAYNSGIGTNSGSAHNLAALAPEIAIKGYGDILINHLKDNQKALFDEQVAAGEEPTGVWQRDINYRAVWGAFKYMYIFNHESYKAPIELEYAPYMIKTCLAVVRLAPNKDYAYNDLMNQWSSITYIVTNVRTHYGAEEANKLYEIIREDPVYLVENTIAKLEPFRMEDGSYCVSVNGTSPASIYGVPICVGGLAEGTVNSTNIVLNIYGLVCSALGCPKFSLCTLEDGWDVVETMKTLEPIDKISIGSGVLDFEDEKISTGITMDKVNATAAMEIVDDPDDDDGALYFYSPVGTTGGDAIKFTANGMGSSCFIFDSDMYISSESTKGSNLLQLKFGGYTPLYMLQMQIVGSEVKITEAASIYGDKVNDISTVPLDTWFNLRIEYYNVTEERELPIIIIYIDEEPVATSDNFYGSHNAGATPGGSFNMMNILSLRAVESKIYFDNILVTKSSDEYAE
ncbi:MAG: hypothetical protein IJW03_01050 [Clostridia bacterium]|nr:hypothetical protein [Clostridia bacterium]